MKIPKKLKVGGLVYKIKEVDVVDGSTENWGYCNRKDLIIEIRKDMAKERKEETFLHELLHACDHQGDFFVSIETLNNFNYILYQVLKDNNLLKEK